MRTVITLAVLISSSAFADTQQAGHTIGGETIVISGHAPPKVLPKPVKNYFKIAPHYSDYAILHDTWAKAFVLLDINARGRVERVKLLKHPGADLDQIAIDTAMKLQFDPAQDERGNAIGAQVIWPIEWPSYWWMVDLEGLATRIPENVPFVPCRGSGPMHMGSIHPAYRDCGTFKLSALHDEPWIEAKR